MSLYAMICLWAYEAAFDVAALYLAGRLAEVMLILAYSGVLLG